MTYKTEDYQHDSLTRQAHAIKATTQISDVIRHYTRLARSGRDFVGLCPFHQEKTPSFSVSDDRKKFHCFGCGAGGDVLDFIQKAHNISLKLAVQYMGGRVIEPMKEYNIQPKAPKKDEKILAHEYVAIPEFDPKRIYSAKREEYMNSSPESIYKYEYGDGKAAGYVVRIIDKHGKKACYPVKLLEHEQDGLVWAFGGFPSPKPLYNLPALLKEREKPVLVVEGEKCADAAKKILGDEFIVTTWCGGSNAVDNTDWGILANREVFMWPDNDTNGRNAAEKISSFLQDVEVIEQKEEWPDKWDIADEIEKGATKEELATYILKHRTPKPKPEPVTYNFDMPPGLLGELTKYILHCSPIKHPILSIGAAISVMAILQAQKCKTEDDIHPNIYVLTLAPSGSGKSFPLNIATKILNYIGLGKLVANKPASGAGLISALHRRQGRLICMIDEFGAVFSGIMNSEAGGYQRDIVTKLLTLYSLSDLQYNDEELSDRDKQREPRIIRKPNLVMYGTTIPDNFYDAVNADDSVNGFLARLLVLQGVDVDTKYHNTAIQNKDMPESLKLALMQWSYDPANIWGCDSSDNYDFAPMKVPYSSEARKIIHEFRDEVTEIAKAASKAGDEFKSSLFRRCYEHASKLALLARSDSIHIDVPAVTWGIKLARESVSMFYEEGKNYMHDGAFGKNSKAVERYLQKKEKWTSLTDIYNRFRMPKKQMKEILDYLLEAELISYKETQALNSNNVQSKPKSLYKYRFKVTK